MRFVVATGVGLLTLLCGVEEPVARAQDGRSLTLAEAVTTGRERSADVREARAQEVGADANIDVAFAGYLPNARADLDGSRRWSHQYQPDPLTGAQRGQSTAALNSNVSGAIRWTAWDFGRTTSAVGAARADARGAAAKAAAAANDAAKNAATLFLTAVFDEEIAGVIQASMKVRERQVALAHALTVAGTRPPVEEARARIEFLMFKVALTKAEQQVAQDRIRLATALFMDPNERVKLVKPAALPSLSHDARHAADLALKNRPEVKAAASSIEAQEENVDAAKAQRLPSVGVSLEGRYQTTKQDDDSRIFPTRGLTAGLNVSVPIFDWNVWGRIPVANANVAAAESRATGIRARVQGQAAEASYGLQYAAQLVEQAAAARELASATLAVMEARYQAGRDGPLDLFAAADADTEARVALIRAELALATATVDHLAATGRIAELSR